MTRLQLNGQQTVRNTVPRIKPPFIFFNVSINMQNGVVKNTGAQPKCQTKTLS